MNNPQTTAVGAQERAAQLLVTPGALAKLNLADAHTVVRYMQPQRIGAGTVFIHAGETSNNDYMLLIIDGDVTVESQTGPEGDGLVVSVLGPGSLIGAMGLIDGAPRSATCSASTDLAVALLTREALMRLMEDQPGVAARLLLAVSKRLSDYLREANRKLLALTQISRALQKEVDVAHGFSYPPMPPATPFSD
jgi:CRP-like cAMP-binding protein